MVEFCLVTHRIGAFIEDSDTDLDRKPDYMQINGQVRFTPMLSKGDAVLVTDDEGVRTVPVVPIDAQIIDGVLTHEGEPGVYVFAGGPNSNPESIAYTVEYSGLFADHHKITLRGTSFKAIPGGTVDLAGVTPVAGSTGRGIARGEKGDPFTYDDFTEEQLERLRGPEGDPGHWSAPVEATVTAIYPDDLNPDDFKIYLRKLGPLIYVSVEANPEKDPEFYKADQAVQLVASVEGFLEYGEMYRGEGDINSTVVVAGQGEMGTAVNMLWETGDTLQKVTPEVGLGILAVARPWNT